MKTPAIVFAFLALFCGQFVAAAEPRPNILWIIAEDLGPEALSCFGAPEAKTPVLDQFARDGVRYTRAYTTGPVCSTSRSAFITGMYATTIGAHQHRTENKSPLPAGVRPLPAWLREAGYFTALLETFPDLRHMRLFFLAFPIWNALRSELSELHLLPP